MENLYLTKLEQAVKDGNYEITNKLYAPTEISVGKFHANEILAVPNTNKIEQVYKITFYHQISGKYCNDFYQLSPYYREKIIDHNIGLEDYDLKYILPKNYFRDIDYSIKHESQIDFFSNNFNEIYSKDYYITESKIEKIKENIFAKEIEMEKRMLLKVMEVNNETTTKKRGRL